MSGAAFGTLTAATDLASPVDRACATCHWRRKFGKAAVGHDMPSCVLNPPAAMVMQGQDAMNRPTMQIRPSWTPTLDEAECQHWKQSDRPRTLEDVAAQMGALPTVRAVQ